MSATVNFLYRAPAHSELDAGGGAALARVLGEVRRRDLSLSIEHQAPLRDSWVVYLEAAGDPDFGHMGCGRTPSEAIVGLVRALERNGVLAAAE